MGRGGPFSPGDEVLYSSGNENGGFKIARVLAVDASVVPPAYVVRVDGAERSTEASRLAAPPSPAAKASESNPWVVGSKYAARDGGDEDEDEGEDKHAGAGAGAGGVGKTTTETTSAAAAASVAVAETKPQPPPPPSPGAVASAHELAMEAAGLLSPSDGDPARALYLLRRALAALEGER